ncbi:MAG: hypothetical protein GXO56_06165 [Chloroflexi bacterium]|nr:hypothetical protein [Chloroflexota bacterium]
MKLAAKRALKDFLGQIPLTAETYWMIRQHGQPVSGFALRQTAARLPEWAQVAQEAAQHAPKGKRVCIFATLRYWIAHTTAVGLALAGMGHDVSLAYLPYREWQQRISRFDLRRSDAYARWVFRRAMPVLRPVSLLRERPAPLPPALAEAIAQVAAYDVQYTLQVEDVDTQSPLYRLRLERNTAAAGALLALWRRRRPDVVIVPNGMILEFGAAFQTARFLGIPVATYEFGEQRERTWLDWNRPVMLQDTTALWQAMRDKPLTEAQWQRVQELFAARRGGRLWANFARQWQQTASEGGEKVRAALGLDDRPIFLLATNVLGDSLVLGREVFSRSLAEWVRETVRYFARHPEAQLVVRIHPGERLAKGPSLAEAVHQALPTLPEHIHLIPADATINTYDLMDIASAGLVFTTTVGLEMAMSGLPVVVAGKTHYRDRGFTLDPTSWDAYYQFLDALIANPQRFRLSEDQVRMAWKYAYHFFFDYPRPFPWHVVYQSEDMTRWPLKRVLAEPEFRETFTALTTGQLPWTKADGEVA